MTSSASPERARRFAIAFGAADLIAALIVLFGVFGALPARYWLVDTMAGLVAACLLASSAGLLAGTSWAAVAARIAASFALLTGLALISVLAVTASYLYGIYGQVGRGGALILVLVAVLSLPYLLALPIAQLLWVGPRAKSVP
jgi:hypothetical protein